MDMIRAEDIARINELARKKKAGGLTEAERAEQVRLRAAYLAAFRENARRQIASVSVKHPDGVLKN